MVWANATSCINVILLLEVNNFHFIGSIIKYKTIVYIFYIFSQQAVEAKKKPWDFETPSIKLFFFFLSPFWAIHNFHSKHK